LSGRFWQTRRINGIPTILTSNGDFLLVPDYGLIWRVEQPLRATTIITKEGVRQIVNDNEVQHIEASRTPLVTHLNELLNAAMVGDWKALRHDFVVAKTGDQAWRAILTPLRRDDLVTGTLSSIVITGGATVDNVEISHRNGDSEHLRFFDQTISQAPLRDEDARLLAGKGLGSASHE
jgi:hypothetical protein